MQNPTSADIAHESKVTVVKSALNHLVIVISMTMTCPVALSPAHPHRPTKEGPHSPGREQRVLDVEPFFPLLCLVGSVPSTELLAGPGFGSDGPSRTDSGL